MKTFRDYLIETELTEGNPAVGDYFDLEIARDETLIETYIVDVFEDGIVLEADDTVIELLRHAGYLTEDSNMPTARDSISPIHSNVNKDKSSDDDLENNYMSRDKGATPPVRPTRNAVDTKPLSEPKDKKDPKDYMVHEAPEGWGQDTMTMKDGSVMKYDPKANSYSQVSGPTQTPTKTSMSVIDSSRTRQTDSNKKGSTYDQEYSSTSFARDPKTGTGDYLKTQQKNDDYTQDYQTDVSKPWMDYTQNKAQQDADTMMQEPDGPVPYTSMPQGPMAPFRAQTNEAKYQGRTVPLGKPMAGDVKKSKVYVKKPNGKVVKVNFGDKKMRIKKSNPGRRKNFRARHNCDNPGPRWKARYWSCRAW